MCVGGRNFASRALDFLWPLIAQIIERMMTFRMKQKAIYTFMQVFGSSAEHSFVDS